MNNWDVIIQVISLLASMGSLALAIVAIWLSFKFYKMSTDSSEKIEDANRAISASVDKLEEVFKMQYSDTFSMVRDTYSDFRRRLLQGAESIEDNSYVQVKTDAKVNELKKEVFSEIRSLMAKVGETDAKIDPVHEELEKVVDKAIGESRNIEKEGIEKNTEEVIRQVLSRIPRGTTIKVSRLMEEMSSYPPAIIASALYNLGQEVVIKFIGEVSGPSDFPPWQNFEVLGDSHER